MLRADGTCWLNLGDSYYNYRGEHNRRSDKDLSKRKTLQQNHHNIDARPNEMLVEGLKAKDLIGIPWRVALALQADGWWLRSDIIWHKPNPMPESVTDRPTKAHEYVFLLTKSARYFYDADAIKEDFADDRMGNPGGGGNYSRKVFGKDGACPISGGMKSGKDCAMTTGIWNENGTASGRNKRTVWTIPTKPFPKAHFATFPPALIEPCILAGTSEKGCCVECGSPWERVVEKVGGIKNTNYENESRSAMQRGGKASTTLNAVPPESKTIGWQPTCKCKGEKNDTIHILHNRESVLSGGVNNSVAPCVVLDPFFGSGTTGIVSYKHGRKFIGIELSGTYLDEIAIPRIEKETRQRRLFN